MSGSSGYITVSATNLNDVVYHGDHLIKYQVDSYLFQDLKRYVRFKEALFTGISDFSFELDDDYNPYWVITTYKNERLFALPETTGVIAINAETGESKKYTTENLPSWVDRVQPENFIRTQIVNQGQFVHGIFNFSDKDKFTASNGAAIIYNGGRCYYFTGLTSVGNDESATGFIMVDMITKKPSLYQMNGATEGSAQSSAQGKVQHLGYYASFPLIINIDGKPTFFMTLKDKEGLIKQYAFVSVSNYSTVGVGETISSTLVDYRKAMSGSGGFSDVASSNKLEEINGSVLRIASEISSGETVYKIILQENQKLIFIVPTSVSEEVALTEAGDAVHMKYSLSSKGTASVEEFDNTVFSQE